MSKEQLEQLDTLLKLFDSYTLDSKEQRALEVVMTCVGQKVMEKDADVIFSLVMKEW